MNLPAPLASLSERLFAAWRGGAVSFKAMSFAVVGLINTAVDATIFFLLLAYVTPSLTIANVTAWFVANVGSYVMNSFTTFAAETGGRLNFGTTRASLVPGSWPSRHRPSRSCSRRSSCRSGRAKAIAILVSFAVNFSITHFVVFRTESERVDAAKG